MKNHNVDKSTKLTMTAPSANDSWTKVQYVNFLGTFACKTSSTSWVRKSIPKGVPSDVAMLWSFAHKHVRMFSHSRGGVCAIQWSVLLAQFSSSPNASWKLPNIYVSLLTPEVFFRSEYCKFFVIRILPNELLANGPWQQNSLDLVLIHFMVGQNV